MTQNNSTEINVKLLVGAAANVSTIVAQSVAAINQYVAEAYKQAANMVGSSLRSGLWSSIGTMVGAIGSAGGDLISAGASFKQGADGYQKSKELGGIIKKRSDDLTPLDTGQKAAAQAISMHPKTHVGQGAGPAPQPPSKAQMADNRSSLDYYNNRISSVEAETTINKAEVESRYEGVNSQTQGVQTLGRAFGAIFKGFGDMLQGTYQGISGVMSSAAQNTQRVTDNVIALVQQMTQMEAQLYAALPMVRG